MQFVSFVALVQINVIFMVVITKDMTEVDLNALFEWMVVFCFAWKKERVSIYLRGFFCENPGAALCSRVALAGTKGTSSQKLPLLARIATARTSHSWRRQRGRDRWSWSGGDVELLELGGLKIFQCDRERDLVAQLCDPQ